jgi:hypothetical protein
LVDDSVMGATVSIWVPLAVAALGIVATLGGVVLTRWADARAQRDQWQHEQSVRWLQDRQQAYARLVAALDAWDVALITAIGERHDDDDAGERTDFEIAGWSELRNEARSAGALVELMAPDSVRGLAGGAIARREYLRIDLTAERPNLDEVDDEWKATRRETTDLHDAMRTDLGLAPYDAAWQRPMIPAT